MRIFFAGLRIQTRVMGAIISREIGSRHGEDGFGLFWLFFEPILITLVVISVHLQTGSFLLKYVPIVGLLLTGYSPHMLFRHCGMSGVAMLNLNSGLLYHRHIHFLDLIISRLFIETMTVLLAFVVIYVAAYSFGQISAPYSIAWIYLGWMYHIWIIWAMTFLFTGAGLRWPLVRRLFSPLTLLMLPAYASFFLLAWMSPTTRYYLLFFPPANATEIMRYGFFGDAVPTYFSIPYTTGACLVLTFIGLMMTMHFRYKLE